MKRLFDAHDWLKKAEAGFIRSHGKNMERVKKLRGGFMPEKALYVRLHLLQGVVWYHMNAQSLGRAEMYIKTADQENKAISVSDAALSSLVAMGYPVRLSRRALRVCAHPTDANLAMSNAVTYVATKQAELQKRAERERKERDAEREQKRYGKTVMGKPVDLKKLHGLEQMGFDVWVIAQALRQTDNHEEKTLGLLTDEQQLKVLTRSVELDRAERAKAERVRTAPLQVAKYMKEIDQLAGMGFDRKLTRYAVVTNTGNTQAAMAMLTSSDAATLQSLLNGADELNRALKEADGLDSGDDDETDGAGAGAGAGGAVGGGPDDLARALALSASAAGGGGGGGGGVEDELALALAMSLGQDSKSDGSAAAAAAVVKPPPDPKKAEADAKKAAERKQKMEAAAKKRAETLAKEKHDAEVNAEIESSLLDDGVGEDTSDPDAVFDLDLRLETEAIEEYTKRIKADIAALQERAAER